MNSKPKFVAYTRDPKTRNAVAPYESKFSEWIRVVAEANASNVKAIIIAEPWVIGDTYEEIIESLSRLGGTNLGLRIALRKPCIEDN